jgi:hypothetical protein
VVERFQPLSATAKPGNVWAATGVGKAASAQVLHLLQLPYHQVPAINHKRVISQNKGFDNRMCN